MDHMEPADAVVVRKEPRLPRDLHSDLTPQPISRSVPSKKHDRCNGVWKPCKRVPETWLKRGRDEAAAWSGGGQ